MQFEWYKYDPLMIEYSNYFAMLKELPRSIQKEFIQDPRLLIRESLEPGAQLINLPYIESHKKDVLGYLDRVFQIGLTDACKKTLWVEINGKEIDRFTHFKIFPKALEMDRVVFGEEVHPLCYNECCYFGSILLQPVRIKVRTAKKLGIGIIGRAWGKVVELVISAELKRLFQDADVSGLEYEQMEFQDSKAQADISCQPMFLARINNQIYQEGDNIWIDKVLCEDHHTVRIRHVSNLRIHRNKLPPDDFLEIEGVLVEGQPYNWVVNDFIVSHKVAELLFKHKITGLEDGGFFLNTKIKPIIELLP